MRTARRMSKKEKADRERNIAITLCALGTIALIVTIAIYLINPNDPLTCDLQTVSGMEKLFSISATFGSFTFAQAKVIDATWDLAVGQGGRAVLAWMLYKHISRWMITFIDAYHVPYNLFVTTMFSTDSCRNFWHLLKCMKRQKLDLATRCKVLLLVWGTGHVLLFPTLWSAATGYVNPSRWDYAMPGTTFLSTSSQHFGFCWNCTDCSRLNIENGTTMYSSSFSQLNPSFTNYSDYLNAWDHHSDASWIDRHAFAIQGVYLTVQSDDKSDLGSLFSCMCKPNFL